jgi:serine/threonine protein kinase
MDGEEWKDVSPEAKDLVSRMLLLDPSARITTQEILDHPWLHMDDFDDTPINVTDGTVKRSIRPTVHLSQALQFLSNHVQDLKVEKLATSFTRLVSSLANAQKGKSYLSQFVRPKKKSDDKNDAVAYERTLERIKSAFNTEPEELMAIQSPAVKRALVHIFNELGEENGKLSMSQFGCLLMHFIFGSLDVNDPGEVNDTPTSSSSRPDSVTTVPVETNPVPSPASFSPKRNRPLSMPSKTKINFSMGLPEMLLCRYIK